MVAGWPLVLYCHHINTIYSACQHPNLSSFIWNGQLFSVGGNEEAEKTDPHMMTDGSVGHNQLKQLLVFHVLSR